MRVVPDNLNAHKKNDDWLAAHPKVSFHFIFISASWLSQVQIRFDIFQGNVSWMVGAKGGGFLVSSSESRGRAMRFTNSPPKTTIAPQPWWDEGVSAGPRNFLTLLLVCATN
jgi:hypothetical protein